MAAAISLDVVFEKAVFSRTESSTTIYVSAVDGVTFTTSKVTPKATTALSFSTTYPLLSLTFSTVVAITVPTNGTIVRLPATSTSVNSSTTATSSETSSANSTTPDGPHLFSGDQVAGITVGTAIAAALLVSFITLLVLCFCLPRRRSRSMSSEQSQKNDTILRQIPARQTSALELRLSDPLEDRALEKDMSTLETLIDGHVGSFFSYGSDRAPPAIDDPVLA